MTDPPRPCPPRTPTTVASDEALSAAIDSLLRADPIWTRDTGAVGEAQDPLRADCDDEAWQAYLDVEARVNERLADALELVARWAFGEGRRCG